MIRFLATLLCALAFGTPGNAVECGSQSNPCEIGSGAYHVALPVDWDGGPAVIYLHGFAGSGAKVIRNKAFVNGFTNRGYAVIAPNALPLGDGRPTDWSVRDGFIYARDDIGFLRDVLADATRRLAVDGDRVLLSGFSRGGSMVWEVACLAPDLAHAYAPVAGGFWLPKRTECAAPVRLLHTHGFADRTVPLEGRSIADSVTGQLYIQDDVWAGLNLWRRVNDCSDAPAKQTTSESIWRRTWTCRSGHLELLLHKGRHGRPKGWTSMVLDWFEDTPAD